MAINADRTLIVIADTGSIYKLEPKDWEKTTLESNEAGDLGISRQLEAFGSYLAFVPLDIATDLGTCCIVLNQKEVLFGRNSLDKTSGSSSQRVASASISTASTSTASTSGPLDAERTILNIADNGKIYRLEPTVWEDPKLELTTPSSLGIARQLESLGSSLAFVPQDIAIGLGTCCIVLNLKEVLRCRNLPAGSSGYAAERRSSPAPTGESSYEEKQS